MLKHYLKYAIRNFRSNQLVFAGSLITVILSALCISLLYTYIHNELSMDDFHKQEKDIYLLTIQQSAESQVELVDAEAFFKFNYKEYPGIENFVTLKKYKKGEINFEYNKNIYTPEGIIADSTFFEIFDFKLKEGERSFVLKNPNAIVLTEHFARQLFGDEDPIGKVVKVTARREYIYTVNALVESPPPNSSITFDFVIPAHSGSFSRSGANFILVNKHFNKTEFVNKMKNLGQIHPQFKDSQMDVIPLDDIYFAGSGMGLKGIFSKFGNKKSINVLLAIIGVIFVISLMNFINLQVINVNSSVKNIGINKISGAGKKHILYQKITELSLLIVFSAILTTIEFSIALPWFNKITGVELSPEIWQIFILCLTILVLFVVIAIIYPSLVYFKISITNSLRNQIYNGNKLVGRNVVATVQFALSLVLLISSIVVVKQLNLMLHRDLGFTSENIISTQIFKIPRLDGTDEERQLKQEKYLKNYQYVKNELSSSKLIKNFTQGSSPINVGQMPWKLKRSDKDYVNANHLSGTFSYQDVFELQLVEGRFFEKERDESRDDVVVINEAAKKYFGVENISDERLLNKYWSIPGMGTEGGYEIVGVLKDFNSEHLSKRPQPLVMVNYNYPHSNFLIRFEEGSTLEGIKFVKDLFNEVNPGEPFDYSFLSDEIAAMYQKERQLSKIYILFTIVAYLITSIGLFAISLYDTRRRTKEIGVRKVNGAKVSEILAMLNTDFIKWVVIAFVVATPIAYYAMNKWLENFACKIALSWWIFALSGLLALGIALLTISFQSWRAATRNPVEALRYE